MIKKLGWIAITICFVIMFSSYCLATDDSSPTGPIKKRFDFTNIVTGVDDIATKLAAVIKTVVAVLTVLMIVSVGFALWRAQDAYVLRTIKLRIMFIFIGLFFVFLAEPIARFVLSIIIY